MSTLHHAPGAKRAYQRLFQTQSARTLIYQSALQMGTICSVGLFFILYTLPFIPIAFASTALGNTSSFSLPSNNIGLVAYWPFDGNTINWNTGTAADLSGNGNTGTFTNVATSSAVIGKIGGALKLSGSSYVTTAYTIPAQSSATSFTWSAWIKLSPTSNGNAVILGFRTGATWVKLTPTKFEYSGGLITYSIPTNQWLEITIVKNGSNFTYYQNGVVIGTASNSTSAISHVFDMGEDPGSPGDGAAPVILDDVRIYNRALSQQEVQQIYTGGSANVAHSNTVALSNGLVGYWPLDGSATNWAIGITSDLSSSVNNISLAHLSTTSTPVVGKIGQAFSFNGSTGCALSSGAPSGEVNNKLTLSYWIKTTTTATSVETMSEYGSSHEWEMWIGTAGKISFYLYPGDSVRTTASTINDGKWHNVVAVYDGVAQTQNIYVDGILNNGTLAGTVGSTRTVGSDQIVLGAYVTSTNGSCAGFFKGSLDDVRIYNRALSQQEVQQLYAQGVATIDHSNTVTLTSGLVGYWPLDGSTINWNTGIVSDSSGKGNNGSLVSMSTSTSPVIGKIGSALKFNGSTSYITVPDSTPLNIAGSVTVAAWINSSSNTVDQKIVGKQDANNGYKMSLYSNGKVEFELDCSGTATNDRSVAGGTVLAPNTWYYAVDVYNSATNLLSTYINGVLDRSLSTTGSVLCASTGVPLQIGAATKDGTSNRFLGKIDDVRIYNRALSSQEIQQLYMMGK